MKKFDLHKIMSNAHKFYKNVRAKYPTFSAALKKAWSMAKFEAKVAAELPIIQAERKAAEERKKAAIEAAMAALKTPKPKAESYDWGNLKPEDIYPDNNRGYLGSKYCGD